MSAAVARRAGNGRVDPGAAPLGAEPSGCAAILAGPICELPEDGALRIWVRALPSAVTFETDAGAVSGKVIRELEGGATHRVVVPPNATELRVRAKDPSRATTLRLAPRKVPPWLAPALAARRQGNREGATALISAGEGSSEPQERAFALGLRARMELSAGRQEASFPLFRESIRLHRQAGRLSDAADDGFALAFALNQRSHRYAEARSVLDDVHAWSSDYPDGRARESYYRGTLATETGDARAALRLLEDARSYAARLGLATLERNSINARALQLELLGRAGEALELLRDLERATPTAEVSACERVEIAINLAYGILARADAKSASDLAEATRALERALALDGCSDRFLRTAALGNLALAALERGELGAARAHLERARGSAPTGARGVEVLFWRDLDGRIALAEGNARGALEAFEEEARLSASMVSFDAEWRAALGRGEALERLGKLEAALESYRAAERSLTVLGLLVPLGEGRGAFIADRERSARLAIDLLVRLRRTEEAFAVMRASRVRLVAGLARRARLDAFSRTERSRWEDALGAYRESRARLDFEANDDWKLPRSEVERVRAARERREAELRRALEQAFAVFAGQDAPSLDPATAYLPSPAPGELVIAYHPVRNGWIGLAVDASGATSFGVPRLPAATKPEEAFELLLSPIHGRIERARRLHVLAYGPLRFVDFHALPHGGEPLVTRVPVDYPLDLPTFPGPDERDAARAVVVTNPTLDLPAAQRESAHVVSALKEHGWRVTVLDGPRATSTELLSLFRDARLLHYAGHGVFAGREGWQSALPLAAGSHLSIGDVVASGAVPRRVVLSGCETGRSADDAKAESLGLAQAFVLAGADFVIAPVRPVDDAFAARLARALYGGLAPTERVDPAAVLRDATISLRGENPTTDWSAFRVITR